jgi:hypothetical protein
MWGMSSWIVWGYHLKLLRAVALSFYEAIPVVDFCSLSMIFFSGPLKEMDCDIDVDPAPGGNLVVIQLTLGSLQAKPR